MNAAQNKDHISGTSKSRKNEGKKKREAKKKKKILRRQSSADSMHEKKRGKRWRHSL